MSEVCQRVEKHEIKSSNPYFFMLMDFCHKAKNLYNYANYVIRQGLTSTGKYVQYAELDRMLKGNSEYPDYKEMPTAQSAQQILRLLDKNWKSFFRSIKDWKKAPEKYFGRPKPPKYLKKDGNYLLVLTNQNCKLKNGNLCFPKSFRGFCVQPRFIEMKNFNAFHQVRVIPHRDKLVLELIYSIRLNDIKEDNHRYAGIDIGVDNLMTVCNNISAPAFIVNGRPVKSVNQFYNKQSGHYREICKRMNHRDYSARMDRLTEKRNARVDDYLHKASRYVVNWCAQNHINTIVIGSNKEWKQRSCLSKKVNQHFVQLPFARLINMIQYKAHEYGITVVLTEESYTSGTSFIDNEVPEKESYNKKRRVHRGMFISENGTEINADLNGAYQIVRKVFPIKWDRGCALHPSVVDTW